MAFFSTLDLCNTVSTTRYIYYVADVAMKTSIALRILVVSDMFAENVRYSGGDGFWGERRGGGRWCGGGGGGLRRRRGGVV